MKTKKALFHYKLPYSEKFNLESKVIQSFNIVFFCVNTRIIVIVSLCLNCDLLHKTKIQTNRSL